MSDSIQCQKTAIVVAFIPVSPLRTDATLKEEKCPSFLGFYATLSYAVMLIV